MEETTLECIADNHVSVTVTGTPESVAAFIARLQKQPAFVELKMDSREIARKIRDALD